MEIECIMHAGTLNTLVRLDPPITGDLIGDALEIISGHEHNDENEGLRWFTVSHSPESQTTINGLVRQLKDLPSNT